MLVIIFHDLGDAINEEKRLKTLSRLSFFITAISNISVQYNFQAISIALLIMSEAQCTASEADCMV